MRIQTMGSKQASFLAVFLAMAALVISRISYLNARLEVLGSAFTLVGYLLAAISAAAALIFMIFYARNKIIIAVGICIVGIFYVLLGKLDSVYIAYWIAEEKYQAQVARVPGPGPKFLVFKLKEGFGFPAGGAWEYIIYDSTDEFGLPRDEKTEGWEKLHGGYLKPPSENCEVITRHLEGHFFYLMQLC
jgi:hypothetical protein